MGYTKLFNEILLSTVWQEPDHVRLIWIALLAMKDERHEVMFFSWSFKDVKCVFGKN